MVERGVHVAAAAGGQACPWVVLAAWIATRRLSFFGGRQRVPASEVLAASFSGSRQRCGTTVGTKKPAPSCGVNRSPFLPRQAQEDAGRITLLESVHTTNRRATYTPSGAKNAEGTLEAQGVKSKSTTSLGGRGVVRSDWPSSRSALHEVAVKEMPDFTGQFSL